MENEDMQGLRDKITGVLLDVGSFYSSSGSASFELLQQSASVDAYLRTRENPSKVVYLRGDLRRSSADNFFCSGKVLDYERLENSRRCGRIHKPEESMVGFVRGLDTDMPYEYNVLVDKLQKSVPEFA